MKKNAVVLALGLVLSSLGCAADEAHHVYKDSLDIYGTMGHLFFVGEITTFDTEDSIYQIEINKASTGWTGFDGIFSNGFEVYKINWLVVGDDTNNNEFGFGFDCLKSYYYKDSSHNLHVTLSQCYLMLNAGGK